MSIFPKDDLLSKEIESWKAYAQSLRAEDRVVFNKMIKDCYKHIKAIQIKGESYSTESLLMSMIISQQQMIEFLLKKKR